MAVLRYDDTADIPRKIKHFVVLGILEVNGVGSGDLGHNPDGVGPVYLRLKRK